MHERSSFLTLTYNDNELPADGSIDVRPLQLFMKKLRKSRPGRKLRYLASGEYGEELGRPHYHMCLFGEDFAADRIRWKKTAYGWLYKSEELNALWGLGFCLIGNVDFESASYVARYTVAKVNGESAPGHYGPLRPEFLVASKGPGIGGSWFERYFDVVKRDDFCVMRGFECPVPKFYDVLHSRLDPDSFARVRASRIAEAQTRDPIQRGPERLSVRERVVLRRIEVFKRSLDKLE